jgi:parallel beta-helix repeat protein
MTGRFLASLLAIVVTTVGAAAWAADCGDTAGVGGTRVACTCGDTVVTNTALKAGDPVVSAACVGLGLSLGADDITLNCNGRQITGDLTNAGILLEGRTGVTVRNCKLATCDVGIDMLASSGNALLGNAISDCFVAIRLDLGSDENLIKGNRVVALGEGIVLGSADRNHILTNTLDGVMPFSGDAIDLDGPASGNTVEGNRITRFGGTGIEVDLGGDNVIAENAITNTGVGIRVTTFDANTIERNTADDNEVGLDITGDGHTVDRNRARGNFNGFIVSGNNNRITRNTADSNVDSGFTVDGDGNVVDLNRGQGNGRNGLELTLGVGNRITRNTFDGNVEDGIFVSGDDGIVDGNRGRNNGDDGLEVEGSGYTVSNNTFNRNADWGICIRPGNTDGGANRAQGNGTGQITFDCP